MTPTGCFNSARPEFTRNEIFGPDPAWDDDIANQSPPIVAVRSIRITGSSHTFILSIQVTYEREDGTLYVAPIRGSGSTFQVAEFTLAQGECIVQVQGVVSSFRVRPLELTFNTVQSDGTTATYGPFGRGSGTSFSVEGNILGFFGSGLSSIAGLGFYYQALDLNSTTASGNSGEKQADTAVA